MLLFLLFLQSLLLLQKTTTTTKIKSYIYAISSTITGINYLTVIICDYVSTTIVSTTTTSTTFIATITVAPATKITGLLQCGR